ncbi:MAG: aminotransferase class I/II-fold pyridoxal phosphate-dependent enzyme [bacterium]|nr:aminotransferase class I/II-fold pyridoxal phosphate-dependent enzyme [bacterium]
MLTLEQRLAMYDREEIYPFHMPGHKRKTELLADAYHLDITEIDGFDNLHHASGILSDMQNEMAGLRGTKRTYFLINGSTSGILSAISAMLHPGEHLLMARNSHKAAYHAVQLRKLTVSYVYPVITKWDLQGAISAETVKEAFVRNEQEKKAPIQAVYLTSPTYDGVVSDIEAIAKIVHDYGKVLIVDEAHGAHFGFHEAFPQSAIQQGADVVIQSVHKTLPSFTQTALLHICSDRVDVKRVEEFLGIYQSSSPSYVLMAGMSRLAPFLTNEGALRFRMLSDQLQLFYEKAKCLKHLHVLQEEDFSSDECFQKDSSKILISTRRCNIDGKELYERLLKDYKLQLEMYSGEYAVALCSLMDTEDGFERLLQALLEIDDTLEWKETADSFVGSCYIPREYVCEIAKAAEAKKESVLLEKAVGAVSGEYVYLYPPGIPLLTPGERIDEAFVRSATELKQRGMQLEGMRDFTGEQIEIAACF